jgi:hypothetical protein
MNRRLMGFPEGFAKVVSRVHGSKQRGDATLEALGLLHVIRFTAKDIQNWRHDPHFDVDASAQKILALGMRMHVLLGGKPPGTYGEAVIMDRFPDHLEPHEWDNMTSDEQRQCLLRHWRLPTDD